MANYDYIARGIAAPDLSGVAALNQQKQYQNAILKQRQDELAYGRQQDEAERGRQSELENNRKAFLGAQWVAQSSSPKAAAQAQFPQAIAELRQAGYDWDKASDDDVRGLASRLMEHYGPLAGQGPPQPMGGDEPYTLGPGSARYGPDNRLIAQQPFAPPNQTVIQLPQGQAVFNPRTGRTELVSTREDQRAAEAGDVSAKTGAQKETERLSGFVDEGVKAADATAVLRRGIELLNEVKTGGFNLVALKASNLFGVTGADEGELSANLGKAVLAQLRRTFGAQFTEREGARLQEIEAGFGKSTAANKRLLEQTLKIVEREARRGLDAAEQIGDKFSANEIRNALGTSLTPGAGPSNSGGPRKGEIVDGYRFKGGDPSKQANWEKVR